MNIKQGSLKKRLELKSEVHGKRQNKIVETTDARISLSYRDVTGDGKKSVVISIDDGNNYNGLIELTLNSDQFLAAISNLGYVPCKAKINLFGIEKLNMKAVLKYILVEIEKGRYYHSIEDKKYFHDIADKNCPEGWKPTYYFNSQSSIQYKDEKIFANCEYVKWVERGEYESKDH